MEQSGIPFAETARYWLKLGFINFGGPTGQIAMMHKDLVERKKWIAEDHFLQALNFCMLLPGPEAQQLATYIGWHLNGKWGGIAAGGLFVLPSIFILLGLAWLYTSLGTVPMVTALFYGLKPAVVAIVLEAVLRIGKKTLKARYLYALAAAAFVGIYFFNVPFPVIILSAGLIGYFSGIAPANSDAPAKPPAQRTRRTAASTHVARGDVFSRSSRYFSSCGRCPLSSSDSGGAGTTPSSTSASCSARPRSSPSAAHTPCWGTSASRP